MSYGFKFSTRTKLMAGAFALILAGVSHASSEQIVGGATLPSVGYVGSNAASTTNLQFFGSATGTGVASGSLFGQYAAQPGNPGVAYCLTGSGAGKDVLAGGTISGNTYSVQNNCAKNANGVVNGFGADSAGLVALGLQRTDLTQPNLAAADSPIAASDLSNYQTGHGSTSDWPTQFPVISGSIAIAFNLKDNTGAQITSSEVNFTDAQVCSIFSGTVTTWNDSSLASAFTLPAGRSIPANTIEVQYRGDGSGTSFSFSNHLATVCTGLAHDFETSQTFVGASPAVTSNFFTTAPSNWTPGSGNNGVATNVSTTANSIGYVETANVLNSGLSLQFADVNSTSPVTNFGTALTLLPADYVFNNVISGTNASNGQAQLTPITGAPSTSCIVLVKPSTYAQPTRGGLVPTGSYPIVAISYFLGNAQGNLTADLPLTANLANAPYNSTITSGVTTVGSGKGLAFLTLGTGAFSATAAGSCLH
jgi:phosphate transport system substrate-binding protein